MVKFNIKSFFIYVAIFFLLIAMTILLAYSSVYLYKKYQRYKISKIEDVKFTQEIVNISKLKKEYSLKKLTDFEWDKVCLISGYDSLEKYHIHNEDVPPLNQKTIRKLHLDVWVNLGYAVDDMGMIFIKNNQYTNVIKLSSDIVKFNYDFNKVKKRCLYLTEKPILTFEMMNDTDRINVNLTK